ncbi:MAG: TetR/AcrR family transcriptional regulator [Candidatus Dormibacteria bacterium]
MSPRPYQLGKRQDLINESRQRVIEAARGLLAEGTSYSAFTVDAVAKRANVARATVYYQFESKTGLLEALCDALAEAAQMSDLAAAFRNPDPIGAIRGFISCFGRFWDVDRLVMRRLRSLAALEYEVGLVIGARDQRRRSGLSVLVGRLNDQHLLTFEPDRAVRMLYTLTSFETFDFLAAPGQPLTELSLDVLSLAEVVWAKGTPGSSGSAVRARTPTLLKAAPNTLPGAGGQAKEGTGGQPK